MTFTYPTVLDVTPDLSGLYRIDHEAYHSGPGISSSDIKNAIVSYGHFLNKKESVDAHSDSPAKAFGRAFHMAILEPDLFIQKYVVSPKFDRRTKEGKSGYEEWAVRAAGKEVIDAESMNTIDIMLGQVAKHPLWSSLGKYDAEIMGVKIDEPTGLQLKCKADLLGGAIVDVKTTACAAPHEFKRACLNFGYHISAAFYQDLMAAITGEILPFIHVVVEKEPPYGVAFYSMPDNFLAEGRKLWKAAAKRIVRWGQFPPERKSLVYGDTIQVLQMPQAAVYKTLDLLAEMESEI